MWGWGRHHRRTCENCKFSSPPIPPGLCLWKLWDGAQKLGGNKPSQWFRGMFRFGNHRSKRNKTHSRTFGFSCSQPSPSALCTLKDKRHCTVKCMLRRWREGGPIIPLPQTEHSNLMLHQNHLKNLFKNSNLVDLKWAQDLHLYQALMGWAQDLHFCQAPMKADVTIPGTTLVSKNTLIYSLVDLVNCCKGKESQITHGGATVTIKTKNNIPGKLVLESFHCAYL